MQYMFEMEELLPLVKELTEKYTSKASTSVTYETAQQPMGAILYCLREREGGEDQNAISVTDHMTAQEAYQIGYDMVVKKVHMAAELYNKITEVFHDYGNAAYQEAVMKQIPEFFKWYNARFCPQETGMLFDYPLLISLKGQGIDEVYQYVRCIGEEQKFLNALDTGYVREVLLGHHLDYRHQFINVCGVVLKKILINLLLENPVQNQELTDRDLEALQKMQKETTPALLSKRLEGLLNILIGSGYQGDRKLFSYLKNAIPDMAAELINGVI